MILSKLGIHTFFVTRGETTRSGGGTLKKKYMYTSPPPDEKRKYYEKIKNDPLLEKYFTRLQSRDRKLAPPPKPNK